MSIPCSEMGESAVRLTFMREAERRRPVGDAIVLVAWFALNAVVVRLLCCDRDGYSSFWTANAALVAALLVLRARPALAVMMTCFAINIALNLLKSWPLTTNVLYAGLNLFQAVIAAACARRFCGAKTDLTRIPRLAMFGLIALGSACIELFVGRLLVPLVGGTELSVLERGQWALCDALGLVLAMPVTMALIHSGLHWPDFRAVFQRRHVGKGVLATLTTGVAILSFVLPNTQAYLFLYPCLSWLAMQLGPAVSQMAILFVSIAASALTVHGIGPVAMVAAQKAGWPGYMLLQPVLITLLLTAFPANILLAERARSERRLRLSEIRLRHASSHDPLTLLMTRWPFRRQVIKALDSGRRFTLLFLDIDHFKAVNDTLGHGVGDGLLQAFASRLLVIADASDGRAARFGGDEFVLMMPIDTAADCTLRCGEILEILQQPYEMLPDRIVTVSIGAAISTPHCDASVLLQRADEALYAAKAGGRSTFRLLPPDAPALQSVA